MSRRQIVRTSPPDGYATLIDGIGQLLEQSRRHELSR